MTKKNIFTVENLIKLMAVIMSIVLVLIDQITKSYILFKIPYNKSIKVIDGFFDITYVRNTGAAWGLFSDRTDILTIITIAMCMFLLYVIFSSDSRALSLAMGGIIGGAVGNIIDRIRLGYVVDFLDFDIFGYDFPVFNFADMCITVSCFFLIIYMMFIHKTDRSLFNERSLIHKLFFKEKAKESNEQ